MTDKEKREGLKPSQRDGKRDETDSLTTDSITYDFEKVKQICETLREFASAARYAFGRGEQYASLPIRREDAEAFEVAARLLESAGDEKNAKTSKREPVGEFRTWALEIGSAELYEALGAFEEMRRRKKKPLTDVARHRAISKLQSLSSDPREQAEIVLQSVDHSWDGFFSLKDERRSVPRTSYAQESTFDTNEFFEAALARTLRQCGT